MHRRGTARIGGRARALRRRDAWSDRIGLGPARARPGAAGDPRPAASPPTTRSCPSGLPFIPPFHGGHLLGTDEVGHDIFSRVLFGLRTSLLGVVIVVTSGVRHRRDRSAWSPGSPAAGSTTLLMRITDLFLALPGPGAGHRRRRRPRARATPTPSSPSPSSGGPSTPGSSAARSAPWPPAHTSRRPRLAGAGPVRRAFRHLLPGAVPAIVVTASLDVGNLVVTLAVTVVPRPRRARAGPRARCHGRPRACSTCCRSGGSRSCRASSSFLLALAAEPARATPSPTPTGAGTMSELPKFIAKRLIAMVLHPARADGRHLRPAEAQPHRPRPRLPRRQRLARPPSPRESAILGYDKPAHRPVLPLRDGPAPRQPRGLAADPPPGVDRHRAPTCPATLELTHRRRWCSRSSSVPLLGLASAGRWRGAGVFRVLMIAGASVPVLPPGPARHPAVLNGDLHLAPGQRVTPAYTNAPTGPDRHDRHRHPLPPAVHHGLGRRAST